jgi:hypothetical protein
MGGKVERTPVFIKQRRQQHEKTTHRMEKLFANHLSDKELTSRIYQELNIQQQTTQSN